MTNQTLKGFIDHLNNHKAEEHIFLRPLTTEVDFAIVWDYTTHYPSRKKTLFGPLSFYFVKNSEGVYVATVSDMTSDLHWFVLPQYRGKGHLTKALATTILPHVFQDNRTEQRITIDRGAIKDKNYFASLKVAKTVGFVTVKEFGDKTEMKISNALFRNVPLINEQVTGLSEERMKRISEDIADMSKMLLKFASELQTKLGLSDDVEEIKAIVEDTVRLPDLVNSAYWNKVNGQ